MVNLWPGKARFVRGLKRNRGLWLVAEDTGKIIGMVCASENGVNGHIFSLGVDAVYQRKGIGTRLVREAVKALRKRKISFIFGHVVKANMPSLKLLQSLGFGIRKTHYLVDNRKE